jgi:phosphatidylglycerol:prolipoprotein diacylglycerol transferase
MRRYLVENLFGVQGFDIAWYGVIIAIGMLLGMTLAIHRARRQGFKSDLIVDFLLIAIPVALVFARLYYVVFEWQQYAANPIRILAIQEGGLAIYGGVIGGVLTAWLYGRRHKIPFLAFTDLLVPSLVLGQAIGRWGNFVNQEAFGNPIVDPRLQFFPFGVFIDRLGEWHQATFFYESAWNFCLLAVMLLMARKSHRPGLMLATYFFGYGSGRFLIEGLRTDSLYLVPGIRVSQVLSIGLVLLGALLLVLILRKKAPNSGHAKVSNGGMEQNHDSPCNLHGNGT